MKIEEFGQKIKAKYPQYQDLPDADLGQKMLTKYPQYKDIIDSNPSPVKPAEGFLSKTQKILGSVLPGKQLGTAIGNSIYGIGQYFKGNKQGALEAADANSKMVLPVAGDVAQGILTAAGPLVGRGAATVGRIAANTALGAGIGGTGAVAQGENLGEVAKSTALGGALGGVISGLGETGKYLTENMPRWFTKLALPKLGNVVKGTPQETIDYALKNTKSITLSRMLNNSRNAINSYENQVQTVLNHPQYANESGTIAQDLLKTKFENFPQSEKDLGKILKNVAPKNSSIVDRVIKGTANLKEQNTLRKELDLATRKAYTDTPQLTFTKQVGKNVADVLRANVQKTAPETVPIFSEYSKEHALRGALEAALKKKRVAGPLFAGVGGFAHGGWKGAAEAIAIEEGIRSPTAKLLGAKAIQGAGKIALPIGRAALQGGKAPLIKSLSNRKSNK